MEMLEKQAIEKGQQAGVEAKCKLWFALSKASAGEQQSPLFGKTNPIEQKEMPQSLCTFVPVCLKTETDLHNAYPGKKLDCLNNKCSCTLNHELWNWVLSGGAVITHKQGGEYLGSLCLCQATVHTTQVLLIIEIQSRCAHIWAT